MEENKILFAVTSEGEGSSVKMHTETSEDLFAVALGIRQAMFECPNLVLMLNALLALEHDKDFKKKLEESTFDVPDFDEILKNIK